MERERKKTTEKILDETLPETVMIPLTHLHPSKTQPRKHFDELMQNELAESMKRHGFTLSTLLVRCSNGLTNEFEIVTGERRWRAARAAGIEAAPCYIGNFSDSDVIAIQLVENLQRVDLTPIEEAEGYKQALALLDEDGKPKFTLTSLAQQIAKSERVIRERLVLCNLPSEAKKEVDELRLKPSTAFLIARIPDDKIRLEAMKLVLHPKDQEGPLTTRRAELQIHQQFVRDLRQLPEALRSDAELVPIYFDDNGERIGGGACVGCPFRSKPDAKFQGEYICINPTCFEKKLEREWERWQSNHTKPEQKRFATTRRESMKLFPAGNQLAQYLELVDLEDCPDGMDLRPGITSNASWQRLIGKNTNLKITVTRDRLGKTHKLVDRSQAIFAARANGHADLFKAQRERPADQETRKEQEKRREGEAHLQKIAILACVAQVRKKVSLKTIAAMLRLQIDREIEFSKAHSDFLKAHSLPIGGSVAKQLARFNLNNLVALLVEFVIAEGGFSYDAVQNRRWLEIFGVNFDKTLAIARKHDSRQRKGNRARK